MFTGIIEELGKVISTRDGKLTIGAREVLAETQAGSSMAVNGVCLTVTRLTPDSFTVDVMPETLRRSNLGRLSTGDRVNLERPMPLGGRLGGHLIQGHVDAVGHVVALVPEEEALLVRFEALAEAMYYIVHKGFIAVDGISLTVADRNEVSFQVSIVGFTRQNTTLRECRLGDPVNLEADIIAKYVRQFSQTREPGITSDFLKEHGFLVG
jgi:riboflavin synthase